MYVHVSKFSGFPMLNELKWLKIYNNCLFLSEDISTSLYPLVTKTRANVTITGSLKAPCSPQTYSAQCHISYILDDFLNIRMLSSHF